MPDIDRQYLHRLVDALNMGQVRLPILRDGARDGPRLRAYGPRSEGHQAGYAKGRKEQNADEIQDAGSYRSLGRGLRGVDVTILRVGKIDPASS